MALFIDEKKIVDEKILAKELVNNAVKKFIPITIMIILIFKIIDKKKWIK